MTFTKPKLTFSQIINMNVGFFGIQYSFGLQQTAVNPLFSFLHARPEDLPLLNLAGPVTGLLIQPLIGALSDKTWHPRWGRRKPYFLLGAIGCSLCLFLFPFSSALWIGRWFTLVIGCIQQHCNGALPCFYCRQTSRRAKSNRFSHTKFFYRAGYYACQSFALLFSKNNNRRNKN